MAVIRSPAQRDGPLGGVMPMEFANPARRKAHVHAGDISRDWEIFDGHLARPAAFLNPSMSR